MSLDKHVHLIKVILTLYFIATWTSTSAMEILGWSLFLAVILYSARARQPAEQVFRVIPWKTCVLLVIVVCLGLFLNSNKQADWLGDLGSMRWIFLFATTSIALTLCFPTTRGYRTFIWITALIAIYAIFQSFTGNDLLRPGTHRAVMPLDLGVKNQLFRSAGLFHSPMLYSYVAGQHACFTLAMILLNFRDRQTKPLIFWGSVFAFTLIALSLITTFTRGAWIGMLIAWTMIVFISEKRLAIAFTGGFAAIVLSFFGISETFRLRVLTLFNLGYESNSDRIFLWKINWEMFKDYPLFGIGYQENEARAAEYAAKFGHPHAFIGHAHNNYFQMLSGTGILGFSLYMFLISYMLWLTWKVWRELPNDATWVRVLALGALGAQVFLHVGGFTDVNFQEVPTSHALVVVWSIVIALNVIIKSKQDLLVNSKI